MAASGPSVVVETSVVSDTAGEDSKRQVRWLLAFCLAAWMSVSVSASVCLRRLVPPFGSVKGVSQMVVFALGGPPPPPTHRPLAYVVPSLGPQGQATALVACVSWVVTGAGG